MKSIVETEARRPSDVVPPGPRRRQLRGDLDTIVGKALKKDPAARYARSRRSVTICAVSPARTDRRETGHPRLSRAHIRPSPSGGSRRGGVARRGAVGGPLCGEPAASSRAEALHGRPTVGFQAPGPRCSGAGAAGQLEDQTVHRRHRAGISAAADGRRGGRPRTGAGGRYRLHARGARAGRADIGEPRPAGAGRPDAAKSRGGHRITAGFPAGKSQPRYSARLRSRTIA